MARLAQIGQGCPVDDPVFLCNLPGSSARSPAVTAVPQISKAQFVIFFDLLPDPGIIGFICMPRNGRLPFIPVQNHVHMTIDFHFVTTFLPEVYHIRANVAMLR